jgi:hypothetical protein
VFREQEYLQRFSVFFRNADFSSSYKPVFLKTITDIADYGDAKLIGGEWLSKKDDKLVVELDFLAARYAKYYWDMYYKFRLRQSHNPSDVNIHKFFKDSEQNPLKPPTLADLADEAHKELRSNVNRRSIKPEVLTKLNKDLGLYEIIKGKNYIVFDFGIVVFLAKYRGILVPATDYVLTRYLEKINSAPRIAEKIRGITPRDHLTAMEKTKLLEFHDYICFYCGNRPADRHHFDHVIPFDYIFQTDVFNSVPACMRCNLAKSNRLPSREIFDRVLKRNQEMTGMLKDYSPEWYQNLYQKCLVEYHGNREFFSMTDSN